MESDQMESSNSTFQTNKENPNSTIGDSESKINIETPLQD